MPNIQKHTPEPLRRALSNNGRAFLQTVNAQRVRLSSSPERQRLWQSLKTYIIALSKPRGADVALPHWLHLLVGISDDGLRIPGTRVRFGLDAFLGTVLPGAGDALGGVTALSLIFVAWRRGAPGGLLYRMLGNASLDVVFGSIPIVGDLFDFGFHANRRNLTLLEEHLQQRTQRQRANRLTAVLVIGLLVLVMLLMLGAAVGLVVFSWRELER